MSIAGLRDLPRPVAVAVGGGGVLGAAHVGVGYALEQRGFVPDLVVGTSVGALTGAIAAAHPSGAARWLDDVWTHLDRRQVFPLGYLSSRASVFTDRGLRRLIARAGLPPRIEELPVPFTAVAMDLVTGAEVLLDHGDLESALLASAATADRHRRMAPWDFSHSQRLISTASATAGRFLDRLHIAGAGLYRADHEVEEPLSSVSESGR